MSNEDTVEETKRGAAGLAKTTQGKAVVIPNKRLYKRPLTKKETKEIVTDLLQEKEQDG